MPSPNVFSLSELIKSISDELKQASVEEEKAIIQLERCEIEIAVSFKDEIKGGIKFYVIDAGVKSVDETVSKIKVVFSPVSGRPSPGFRATPSVGKPHGRTVQG